MLAMSIKEYTMFSTCFRLRWYFVLAISVQCCVLEMWSTTNRNSIILASGTLHDLSNQNQAQLQSPRTATHMVLLSKQFMFRLDNLDMSTRFSINYVFLFHTNH